MKEIKLVYTNQERALIAARKANYWRGFRACLIITVPIIVFMCWLVQLTLSVVD